MRTFLSLMISYYEYLLRLYPRSYREDFAEEMLADFSDLATEANEKGKFALLRFCFRELVDFPGNLLYAHLANGGTLRILRSQPVNSGLRGAIGFGVGFAFISITMFSSLVYFMFDLSIRSLPAHLRVAFQTGFLAFTPLAIHIILTGTAFGLLLAVFLGNRTKFYSYAVAGALCWVIPEAMSFVLVGSLRDAYYYNEILAPTLGYFMCVLIGVFLSAACPIAESDRKEPLRYLAAGTVIYPLGTYLFIKLLFYLWREVTPSFSLSLLAFMIGLITCVIVLTMPGRRKLYFVVMAGGIGYFLLNRVLFYVASRIPGFSLALDMGIVPDVLAMPVYYMTIYKAVFGALFGLGLGWMIGVYKKADPQQIVENTQL